MHILTDTGGLLVLISHMYGGAVTDALIKLGSTDVSLSTLPSTNEHLHVLQILLNFVASAR